MKTIATLFVLLTIFSLNTFAQDIPHTTLKGHRNWVGSVAFSPDGKILASGGWDAIIRLWDVETGKLKGRLRGHTRGVISVAFSPDGKILASGGGSEDDTVRLWDVETETHLRTLRGHLYSYAVRSVSFSPDGKTIASSSGDRTIRLWNVETGVHFQTLIGHTHSVASVAFSPDGKTIASGGGKGDGNIRLWDVEMGTHKGTLIGHIGWVVSVAFSPDGKTIASAGEDDGSIHLWDVGTGIQIHKFIGHTDWVSSVAFSPDGSLLASGSGDNTIYLWNSTTSEHIGTLPGHTDTVHSVAFSPDGKTIASGGGWEDATVRLWEFHSTRVSITPITRVSITPIPVVSPAIGEQFTVNVSIFAGENVGGYQMSLVFAPTTLRYVESANGSYLTPDAFFVPPVVSENKVTLGASSLAGVSNGDGTLARVTFEVLEVRESLIELFDVILTDSEGEHLPQVHSHTRVVEPSPLPSSAIVSLTPSSMLSPAVGKQLTFNVDISGGRNVSDFQLVFDYDRSALNFISRSQGNYLAGGVGNGDGTLEKVTFEVLDVKASTVNVSGYLVAPNGLRTTPTFESAKVVVPLYGDVNRDGVVNILDMVLVASSFAQPVPEEGNPADVNEDGVVNIVDLVKVAGALGDGAAAPSVWNLDLEGTFTREQVQQWLSEARQFNLTDTTAQRGILYLEQLLAALTPKETALLPNYPNPFNPETWIPYQLAEAAEITLTIYAVDGTMVRTLALGHQAVGIYESRSHAAYWDGRNDVGESVASGLYFYTLTAGECTATRKMLIRK